MGGGPFLMGVSGTPDKAQALNAKSFGEGSARQA